MNLEKQQMIAKLVKEKRIFNNYTQQELANITNISLRSIQRIEKGQVTPRIHTLKVLSKCLDFSLDFLNTEPAVTNNTPNTTLIRKVILSITVVVVSVLLSAAFIAQSASFPETNFEAYMFSAILLASLALFLILFWKKEK